MPSPPVSAPLAIAEVYIDESSTRHRYLVLGAVVTLSANVDEFNRLLIHARLPELPFGELKWTKISHSKLSAYSRFVDVLFSQPRGILDFNSAIIDTSIQRHQLYNGAGEAELARSVVAALLAQASEVIARTP